MLVHVCRRWRNLVFGSPRRLNLRLFCTPQTPAKYRLDVWPTFPLIISGIDGFFLTMDNVIAALGQSNRVCRVSFSRLAGWQLEKVLAAMQVSFPELTDLELHSYGETPVIPNSFLGGSAPLMRFLQLDNIPFPGLPKLLPSATQLVDLHLIDIPHSGYISPEEMVASLSVLPSLEHLSLVFLSPNLALAGKANCLHQSALSSPLSTNFILEALPNIWSNSWSTSTPLNSRKWM